MARKSRAKSISGYYHVILRGINKQAIFFDDADRRKLLGILQRFQSENDARISAYCLMENHIHLLLHTENALDLFVKKVASSYVFYFNHKYDRIGHLFQDRFRSEPIETDAYLLTAFRYILQNPQKAGICALEAYPWSSWRSMEGQGSICNITQIESIAGSRQDLKEFVLKQNEDQCFEAESIRPLTDDEALRRILSITNGKNPLKIAQSPKTERNMLLAKMKHAGLSNRQISRLTGLNRNMVQRA